MQPQQSPKVPEAFVEVIVYSNEGQCSLVGRRRRALYRSVMQENYRTVSTLGKFPVHTSELLSRLDRGEEAWVPDLQSSEDSADEGPVRPTLKRLPKRGAWWDRYRSPMLYCNSDSSNSDDEPEGESEKEKPQRGGSRLTLLHRNILTGSKGSFKPRETCKNWLQLKKCSRNQVIRNNIAEAGDINGSIAKERTSEKQHWKTCSVCGQSFKSGLSLSNHQRIHFKEAPYKCSICGERFTAKKILARHHRRHAEEKGYKHPSIEKRALKHPKIASAERPHKCPECEKCFHLKKHLLQHQRSHEANGPQTGYAIERPHKCPVCGKGFNRKEHLTRHQKIHTRQATDKIPKGQEEAGVETSCGAPERKPSRAKTRRARTVMSDLGDPGLTDLYKCKFCGKSLRAKIMLIEHERTHTENRPYKCSLCKKSFYYKQSLQNHEKTHRRQTNYKYPKRVKRLSTRSSASYFGMSHTAEHPSIAHSRTSHIARKVITRSLCLAQHKKIHAKKLHKCQYCGKCLSSKDGLTNHERIHRGEKPFRCDECGNCFRQKCHLLKHLESHTKWKPNTHIEHARKLKAKGPLAMPSRINKGWKPYKDLTLRNATRNLHLTRHQKMPTENSLFKCQYCGKCTQTKTSLLNHERIHKGRKPYQCLECGKKFSQKNYLGCHLRGHLRKKFSKYLDSDKKLTTNYSPLTFRNPHKEKLPLVCHKCGKCFSESYHLKRHQKIHSGTKPFSCATCGKGFIQTWHLRRHEKIHLKITHQKQPKVNCVFSHSTNVAGNIKPQVASRTIKRKTSLNMKEGKTGPLMEGSEIRASQSSKREEMDVDVQAEMQVFLSKKSKRKAQQNQKVVRQLVKLGRKLSSKDSALQHYKHSQCQPIQARECSGKAHVLPHCMKKKGSACQQLELQKMITRTSKQENQLAGKQARSCFCQLERPEITPGTKSKNPQTCTMVSTCKSPQKKPYMTISSQLTKNAPKFCKPTSPCLDHPSQSTFLPELLAANELKSSTLQNLGAFSQQKQKRFVLMEVNQTSLTSDKATPGDLKRGRACQRTILTDPQTRAPKKRIISDQDKSEQVQGKHICTVCKKSFRNLGNLLIHEKNHKGDRPFLCMYCGKTFYNISTLRVHVRIHTGEKPFKCSECPFRCNVSSNLSRHKRTHVQERPYPCLHCGKRFWFSNSLLIHSRTHNKKETHTCCDCGRVFAYENFLKLHRRYKHHSKVELPRSGEK